MMKTVYICAPLGGNVKENLEEVKKYTKYALRCGMAPVVPHFYALCLDDYVPAEREMGMTAGLRLLRDCDEMWVFGNVVSAGMRNEIQLCKELDIGIRTVTDDEMIALAEEQNNMDEGNAPVMGM